LDRKKITLIVISVIAAILMCFKIHYDADKFFCGQMLKAIENDDMQRLKVALFFGDPNSVLGFPVIECFCEKNDRRTPLQLACEKGNADMVKVLVENGADANYTPMNAAISPLSYAVVNKNANNLSIVKYLIENGADANSKRYGCNAIDYLLFEDDLPPNGMEILRELVEAGADTHSFGNISGAFYWGHDEVIRYLVEECGSDVRGGRYIRIYCRDFDKYSYETFELMLQNGADPYAKDENGECAMDHLKKVSPEWAETVAEMAKEYGFEG